MGGPKGQLTPPKQTGQKGGQGAASGADQAKEKATVAVDKTKEKAGQVADQATTKVDAGMDKAAGGLDQASDMLREKAGEAGAEGGGMQSVATQSADKLDVAAGYLKEKDTDQLVADFEALVRRKPVESLLVALGVGFLLSKAVR